MRHHRGILVPALLLCLGLAVLTACTSAKPGRPPAKGGGPAPSAPVQPENAKAGTDGWRIAKKGAAHEIEGYADRVSVLPGESFRLYVSTTTPGFKVEAFRTGWYGGKLARLVWSAPRTPGTKQAAAKVDAKTGTATAPWKPSLTVTAQGWPEGAYLLRLTADSGAQRYVPITVRSASGAGRIVVLNATTTWQAYNEWGGHDLYKGPSGGSGDRARAVSFDRPYDSDGAGKFLVYEQPAISLAEKLGLPLAYATDNDLHADSGLLDNAKALLTLGHDEYWSTPMRDKATQARDRGVNIAFLGANAVNRHIRYQDSKLGKDRLVICYKDADEDPVKDPAESTQDWRLDPKPRPESDLIGIMYNCFPAEGAYTIYQPGNWLFKGTGVRRGTRFPGVIGPESDALNFGGPTPRPIEVLASSPINCGEFVKTAHSTYYTTKSGSGVFATGTMRWVCSLRGPRCGHGVTEAGRRFVEKVTTTLFQALAAGPMGHTHPAHDNLEELSPF